MAINRLIISDIDGVVADCSHRLKYIQGKEKNYDKFYGAEMADDDWSEIMRELLQSMVKMPNSFDRAELVFLTGRPERTLELTKLWLNEHIIPFVFSDPDTEYTILGRNDNDHRKSPIVKAELLGEFLSRYQDKFDDTMTIYLFDDDPNNIIELEKKLAEYPYQFKALCVGTGRLEEMENER